MILTLLQFVRIRFSNKKNVFSAFYFFYQKRYCTSKCTYWVTAKHHAIADVKSGCKTLNTKKSNFSIKDLPDDTEN